MREILFRGKRVDNGEWVEGDLMHDFDNIPSSIRDCCGSNPVIPSSVSEFTSLYDKNGEKIFEGDIVKNIDGAFLVCWDKEKCAFIMRFL
jgi:hypothetical protein